MTSFWLLHSVDRYFVQRRSLRRRRPSRFNLRGTPTGREPPCRVRRCLARRRASDLDHSLTAAGRVIDDLLRPASDEHPLAANVLLLASDTDSSANDLRISTTVGPREDDLQCANSTDERLGCSSSSYPDDLRGSNVRDRRATTSCQLSIDYFAGTRCLGCWCSVHSVRKISIVFVA